MKRSTASGTCLLGLSCLLSVCYAGAGLQASEQGQRPFFEARKQQTRYTGPEREDPEPEGLTEVRIGFFGPDDPAHPEGGDIWSAASLALEEANLEGGYHGLPFRLLPAWSDNPWGAGVNQITRLVFEDKVWAILGGIDGPTTHLAEQVVAKARVPLIGPAATDVTVNLANVPWMFSALPGDHVAAPVLGAAIAAEAGRFAVIAATDHDSHMFLTELEKCLTRAQAIPACRLEFPSGKPDRHRLIRQITAEDPRSVILIAGIRDSAELIDELLARGFTGKVFGGPAMARRAFLEHMARRRADVIVPFLADSSPGGTRFARSFEARTGGRPDYAADSAYEGTRLLVAAVRRAGLNRARICDAIQELSPWQGENGRIDWDPAGQNRRPVALGTIVDGRLVPLLTAPAPGREKR